MKTLAKLLLLSLFSEACLSLPAAAERSSRSGGASQSRSSGSYSSRSSGSYSSRSSGSYSSRSSGSYSSRGSGSYSSYGTQRQTQRALPSRQVAPRQVASPSFRQSVAPPRQSLAMPPRQTVNRVPQLSRNDLSPRVTATQPARRTQLSQNRPATRPAQTVTPPARTGITQRTATPSTKALALPGNRTALASSAKNAQPAAARNQASGPRVRDSHPAVVRPGQNSLAPRRPDINRAGATWATNNRNGIVNVSRNFRQNSNWSTRCQDWGGSPWWNRSCVRPWYGGCWNGYWSGAYYRDYCGYNFWYGGYILPGYVIYDSYYPVGWGLLGWGLGSMIYDIGYDSYYNPYPASAVVASDGQDVTYTEPLARLAAPADDAAAQESTRNSESFIADSQVAFKAQNYLVALELADKAIAQAPADGALHEYRALALFALGRYGEAAGVLHPVIASGPGWDWSTMRALYDSLETYTNQLRRLETYTENAPSAADSHFLLGYHYMVCGHLDTAATQFELAAKLMPTDTVSTQLASLSRNSVKDPATSLPPQAAGPAPDKSLPREIIPLDKLQGIWQATRHPGDTITLTFKPDGTFTWTYLKAGRSNELAGRYSINDNGLLVLDSQETQMVANVSLPAEREMKFVLVGGPPADPGLDFKKP